MFYDIINVWCSKYVYIPIWNVVIVEVNHYYSMYKLDIARTNCLLFFILFVLV